MFVRSYIFYELLQSNPVKVLHVDTHRKHTKVTGKILVAGKHLTIGVRGPGEKPSWGGETRLSDTSGSHPGQESKSVSGAEAHIPQ